MAFTHTRGPATEFAAVTPADGSDLPGGATAAIILSAAGTLRMTGAGMADGAFVDVPLSAGMYPISAKRIWATGTTGGITIIACY